ncbi:MAG: SPOR domain-containing protein [Alphaproteobacteria bacterium]
MFRVQLAAFRYKINAVRALVHFNTIFAPIKNLFALLTQHDRYIDQNGVHYRIRTKAMITASAAENICKQVRSAGQKCLVIMHNQAIWRISA